MIFSHCGQVTRRGKNATAEVILEVVNAGGGGMPAYKELLTDEEKQDVIAYVLTL